MKSLRKVENILAFANASTIRHARKFGRIYSLIGATVFFGGIVGSILILDLNLSALNGWLLFANVIIGAPLAIALNAGALKISARIIRASLPFGIAFRTCCFAICANLLPIPAGSIIQASSLASHGGSALDSGVIVIVGNVLSLALIIAVVGAIMTLTGSVAGLPVLGIGVISLLPITVFLAIKLTPIQAFSFIGIRLLRLLVMIFRIQISFLIIGEFVSVMDAAIFSGAVILGTLFVMFPAGLGASESLAAILATATTIPPGAAFLATATNRITTLFFAGLFILFIARSTLDKNSHA